MKKICFFLFIIVLKISANPIEITNCSKTNIFKNIQIYIDSSKSASINNIAKKKFKEYKKSAPPNFGFSEYTYWAKILLHNKTQQNKFVIFLNYTLMDTIIIYDNNKISPNIGYNSPSKNRTIKDNYPNYEISINHNSTKEIFIKFNSYDRVQLPLYISAKTSYLTNKSKIDFINGIFLGIIVIMIIYNLLMFYILKEKNYSFYVLFVIFYLIFQFSQDGIIHNLFLNNGCIKFNHYMSLVMSGLIITILLFSKNYLKNKSFLNSKDLYSYIYNSILYLSIFFSFVFLIGIINYRAAIIIQLILTATTATIVILTSIVSFSKNKNKSIFFLSAWFILLVGGFIYALMSAGVFPLNIFTFNIIKIGAIITILAHSLNIGYQFNRDKLKAIKKNNQLIMARTQALKNMETANTIKDDFIINASNELQNPLNIISKLIETTIKKYQNTINPNVRDNIRLILSQTNKLSNRINDVLDYTNIFNNNIKLSPTNLNLKQLTDITINTLKISYSSLKIKIINNIPENITILADKDRIMQVFYNILDNAFRYTEKGDINLQAIIESDRAILSITDTGIGITEKKLKHIFNVFEDKNNKSFNNSGLGLFIAKNIIEAHKGFLKITSEPTKGTTVRVSIPVNMEHHTKYIPESFEPTIIKPNVHKNFGNEKIILIIVNEKSIQNILYNMLSNQYNILITDTGKDALNHLSKNNFLPNIIIMDTILPDISGFSLTTKIRKTFNMLELPIIMISSDSNQKQLELALSVGANDFLSKKFSDAEYNAKINNHINLSTLTSYYSRFLPKEIIKTMKKENISEIELGDFIKDDFSILFLDIRNFTTMSEELTPKEIFNFLNSFFGRIAPIIRNNNGYIDKYIGDAILAIFPNKRYDAIKSSIEILKQLKIYNNHRKKSNYKSINIGVGVHSGITLLGTIGESNRMDATVISNVVNIASRLESLNKILGTQIITTQDTIKDDTNSFNSRYIGKVKVKGKKETLDIVQVFYDNKKFDYFLTYKEDFEQAISLFYEKKYEKSQKLFIKLLREKDNDSIVNFYLEYIQKMKAYGNNKNDEDPVLNLTSQFI